jgi:hypothetical protein
MTMTNENVHHRLPALTDRRALAFRAYPVGSDASHPTVKRVYGTLSSLVELHDAVANMDGRLAPATRREHLHGPHATTQLRLVGLRQVVKGEREAVAAISDFLDHPAPAEGVIDAANDRELRSIWFSLGDAAKNRMWESMATGGETPLIEALARLPTGAVPDAVRAREVFGSLQRQRYPERVAELEQAQERATWAEGVADQVAAVLDDATLVVGPSTLVLQAA